ncbi:hydroxyacid dehydrogenase [Armatimonas sp.]|uniref:hydroxyacid dehydrogenase n=1 Tax=Armatimonas sp. TaxID=1872638 RepID=UPI00374FFED8
MTLAAFLAPPDTIHRLFDAPRVKRLARLAQLRPEIIAPAQLEAILPELSALEVIFSTWGMPCLTESQLDALPSLRAVFYAAGSVQSFARPLLERGITVVSAWQANAVPVSEFTLAQILLATKGYFRNTWEFHDVKTRTAFRGPGSYGEEVALLGVGAIGRRVIALLKPFALKVLVFDPFLSEEDAVALGVEKVSLDAAFSRGFVVSNHLANNPQTVAMLTGAHFAKLRPGAVFINTGRGQTVIESELVAVLKIRPDLTALLDVTWPEPCPSDSGLWELPSVRLSSHIAGSVNDETRRMADWCLDEFECWQAGETLRYAVTLEMLETMA